MTRRGVAIVAERISQAPLGPDPAVTLTLLRVRRKGRPRYRPALSDAAVEQSAASQHLTSRSSGWQMPICIDVTEEPIWGRDHGIGVDTTDTYRAQH